MPLAIFLLRTLHFTTNPVPPSTTALKPAHADCTRSSNPGSLRFLSCKLEWRFTEIKNETATVTDFKNKHATHTLHSDTDSSSPLILESHFDLLLINKM